jgi:4-diphosphocytidyl-2-C-methyl-D-erythritol kinase
VKQEQAPAKINLFLHVGPRRSDGYHPVCSLMEKISLFDHVSVEASAVKGLALSGERLPGGENTVEKAARLLAAETGWEPAARAELIKNIPAAAGLGGGSSDAASALRLLISEFEIEISSERLAALALAVGADVPFFLEPGPFLAEGAGERLTPVRIPFDYAAVIVSTPYELSAAEVYRRYDELDPRTHEGFLREVAAARAAVNELDTLDDLCQLLKNDLEPAALSITPGIAAVKDDLIGAGALAALMSGSGPSVFGLFPSEEAAALAAGPLQGKYGRAWPVSPIRN